MSNEIDPQPQQSPEVTAIIADLTKLMIGETVVIVPAEEYINLPQEDINYE